MGITDRIVMEGHMFAVNLPELFTIMENGTREQSAEAAHACFDDLMMEEARESKATYLIEPLLNMLFIRGKSIAKAEILCRMNGLLIQDIAAVQRSFKEQPSIYHEFHPWGERHLFGVAPVFAAPHVQSSCRFSVWRAAIEEHKSQLLSLLEEEEETAIQTIYMLHLLQCQDGEIEQALLDKTLHTPSWLLRANGLLALADLRRRAHKPYEPTIAFGQSHPEPLYEAMRAVCMCLVEGNTPRPHDWDALIKGVALPRMEKLHFPWMDGSPAACCAQAARFAMEEKDWKKPERASWWQACLDQTVKFHDMRSRMVTFEFEQNELKLDEECLQWAWNSPMLVADNMLMSLFGNEEAIGEFQEQDHEVREALRVIVEHAIEVPHASKYGMRHLLHPLHYFR
ncbi:hypothetical protein [Paenibacillus sp. 1001270B_150601_E10]|uniref:hypothetical protein n=1 Tax=Paenibacillus sp. 1001270B_150601_E10 TaxID=2787079 RepID=UPI001E3AB6D3|nr:hypothetical protein [Paenibacillus sp. 1001270B_150601_E10]